MVFCSLGVEQDSSRVWNVDEAGYDHSITKIGTIQNYQNPLIAAAGKKATTLMCFATDTMSQTCKKLVHDPIPKLQHRPIGVVIKPTITSTKIPFRRHFNFKKANWAEYKTASDKALTESKIEPISNNYIIFTDTVKNKTIPRGCRKEFISGLSEEKWTCIDNVQLIVDPFSQKTAEHGEKLVNSITEHRKETKTIY